MKAPVDVSNGATVPLEGGVLTRRTSGSFSTSVQVTVPPTATFLAVARDRSWQTGASFTALTVIDIVAVLELSLPSLARNVKLSEPLKFASGL